MCTYIRSALKFRFRLSTMWMGVRCLLLLRDGNCCMIRLGKSVGEPMEREFRMVLRFGTTGSAIVCRLMALQCGPNG